MTYHAKKTNLMYKFEIHTENNEYRLSNKIKRIYFQRMRKMFSFLSLYLRYIDMNLKIFV